MRPQVPIGAVYIYRVNYFSGLLVSMATYYVLCRFRPVAVASSAWLESIDPVDHEFSTVYLDRTSISFDERPNGSPLEDDKISENGNETQEQA
jgi:NCS1 family nucleobase:cation symporter-1